MARCRACDAQLAPDAEWCSQCYTPVAEKEQTPSEDPSGSSEPEPWVVEPPQYSAWKAGPYSFGPLGRIVITLVMVALGVVVYFAGKAVGRFYGIPGLSLVLLFLGIYTVIAILVLWGVWRPTRVK